MILSFGIKSIDNNRLGSLNLGSTKRTSLYMRRKRRFFVNFIVSKQKLQSRFVPGLRSPLAMPLSMAYIINDRMAQFSRLYHSPHIFYTIGKCFLFNGKIFSRELAFGDWIEISLLTHFTIKLVLLLCHCNMILHWTLDGKTQVGVILSTIRIKIKALSVNCQFRQISASTLKMTQNTCIKPPTQPSFTHKANSRIEKKPRTCIHREVLDIVIYFAELFVESRHQLLHSLLPIDLDACMII